jgi:hypothetical protein
MKGGIVYSNFVTTVSPQHAWEALYTDQAMGLGHTLHTHRGKFGGVLNGVDYDVWNPEIDRLIPEQYTPETLERKYGSKEALHNRFWLRKEHLFADCLAYGAGISGAGDPANARALVRVDGAANVMDSTAAELEAASRPTAE